MNALYDDRMLEATDFASGAKASQRHRRITYSYRSESWANQQ